MREFKKLIIGLMAGLLLVPSAGTVNVTASVSDPSSDSSSSSSSDSYDSATSTNPFILPGNTWMTPVAKHGEYVYVTLPIVNMFKYNVKDVIITPVISTETAKWPFEIEATGYTQKLNALTGEEACPTVADRTQYIVWAFKTREDVLNGYYKIDYNIVYTNPACNVESCTISTFVKTIGKEGAGNTGDGTSDNGKTSTPRIIVKGFETNPAQVYAGDTFTLTLHIQNTSKKTPVSNVEFNLVAAVEGKEDDESYSAFLPTSGSSTIYIDKLEAGGSTDITIDLTAKSDLAQKPYVMDVKMAYEDKDFNPFTSTASVSIPVKQESKYETSSPEVMPANIEVGADANVMFSIYNTGKTKLYNVKVRFEGESIEPEETFVGPLAAGATGNVDVMLTGVAPTVDPEGIIKAFVSYEDESGNVVEKEKDITLLVTEPMPEDMGADVPQDGEAVKPPVNFIFIIGVVVALLLAIGIPVTLFIRKRKKKAHLAEIEDLMEEDSKKGE